MVQYGVTMATKNRDKATRKGGPQSRASITFPPEVYKTIEDLARKKKVSIAWIVREAVEKYVADQWPLLAPLRGE